VTRRQFIRSVALSAIAAFVGRPILGLLAQLLERAMAWIEAERAAAARLAMISDQIRYQAFKAMEAMGRTLMMQYYGREPQHIFYYDPAVLKKIALADAYGIDGVVTDVDHQAGAITVDFSGRPPYRPIVDLEWDEYVDPEGPVSHRSSFTFDFRMIE
jgi:hypothetical protein